MSVSADLVTIEVTTTAVHAERVLASAVAELKSHVAYLRRVQTEQIATNEFGKARYTNGQIDRGLSGAYDAQYLLETFTPQGEEEHGNEV